MDLSAATIWWVLAGVLVAAEMTTGTFYLLMVALGLAAAAVGAHVGLALTAQIVVAALISAGTTAIWHVYRRNQPRTPPSHLNRDVNLDIGERIVVPQWDDDGTARVNYRGSVWTVRRAPGAGAATGEHRVLAVEGNWLVVQPVQPLPLVDAASPASRP